MHINNFMSPTRLAHRTFAVVAVAGLAIGAAKMIKGGIDKSKAKKKQAAAKDQMEADMETYMNQEVKNPYANMENTMEDLTVDTKAADFAAQKSEQARADIMGGMAASAGSSGIAALAQSMANQATQDSQAASASIATQEKSNQDAERNEAGNIQKQEIKGEVMVQNAKDAKMGTKIGMSQSEMAAEGANARDADAMIMSGMSDMGSAAGGMTP
tara:strand:- start:269 stop:910 length:642 start_codon:yes stop_codon:yes gene_type:complete